LDDWAQEQNAEEVVCESLDRALKMIQSEKQTVKEFGKKKRYSLLEN
jgi:hypothetical protein